MKKIFCCLGFDALNNTIDSIALITEDGKSFFGEISLDKDRHCFVYNKTTKTARICDVLGNIKTYLADWFQDLIDGPVSWRDIGETNIIKKSNYSFEIWMEDQTCEIIYNNSYLNNPFGSMFSNISNLIYPIPMNMDSLFELSIIKKELQKFSPEKVVWDIEDLSKQPPWGNDISKDITDLSNYFVTSDGNDFLTVFSHALEKAKEVNAEIVIKSM